MLVDGELNPLILQLGSHPQYQALRCCDQCGLLLSAKETKRLEDHFIGKLHVAFVEIETFIDTVLSLRKRRPRAKEYEYELPEGHRGMYINQIIDQFFDTNNSCN